MTDQPEEPDDDLIDGCDLDLTADPTPDDHVALEVLFAEALDPGTDKTVEEARHEWEAVFG